VPWFKTEFRTSFKRKDKVTKCACSHCACVVSPDLCVGANFSRIFEIRDPGLPIRYASFMVLGLRQMGLFAKRVYGPVLKITQRSAHVQNHVSVQRCRKSITTIVLGDHNFPLTGLNFGKLTAFTAIFRHIFTAHVQKRRGAHHVTDRKSVT